MTRWLEQWQKRSLRERFWVMAVVLLCLWGVSYSILLRPQAQKIQKLRLEKQGLARQVEAAQLGLPDLKLKHELLKMKKGEIALLKEELAGVESRLPSKDGLNHLFGELVTQAEGLEISMDAIKQRLGETDEFPEAAIEISGTATYEAVVNYLHRAERLSPFLRIGSLEMKEPQKGTSQRQQIALTLVMPLSSTEGAGLMSFPEGPQAAKLTLPKSIFVTRAPVERKKSQELKVTGIALNGQASTAIVNDQVVRVGSGIDDLIVKQIVPGFVVLSDGEESFKIALGSSDEAQK